MIGGARVYIHVTKVFDPAKGSTVNSAFPISPRTICLVSLAASTHSIMNNLSTHSGVCIDAFSRSNKTFFCNCLSHTGHTSERRLYDPMLASSECRHY